MRRIYAVMISLALLAVTPGVANADPFTRPARNQQAIDFVISRALSQRGVPFSYGGGDANGPSLGSGATNDDLTTEQRANVPGTDPATGFGTVPGAPLLGVLPAPAPAPRVVGFDASGLIVYAFAGAGIKMPRSSGDQYRAAQKIAPSQALPGDLIFYGPDGAQSVALFLGNGQMLEATDPVVKVSPVRTNGMTPYLGRIIA
ncbi:hydrolase [Mycolicibacterium madagascariense]|uniref:Hydrolase n=1 Tax=Mycolicibacterium madagascariense TaxID=212765 RepID=A0A7I7XHD8_9MYCO|nr:NlpC/P60 family peptidoglycan-binding protein RipD [Mycolicibacterium madagascariense]MCV7011515.1 NlpC/P60 family peptidoglycan-binding protein RipD [Mycolicibacterium madagascariense]BBZ28618.1 hydrolase [Mycolicibacterium madagascariense]